MATSLIASLVSRLLQIPERLQATVTAYLLALMLDGPKKRLCPDSPNEIMRNFSDIAA